MKFNKKGTAGLSLFLSIIAMIFVIGIIVVLFSIMGAQLYASTTDAGAHSVINNTTSALAQAPTYFPIFITIGAIVVMILLIVLIISALRSSGMMGGGQQY